MVNTNLKKEPKKGREAHFWQRVCFIQNAVLQKPFILCVMPMSRANKDT